MGAQICELPLSQATELRVTYRCRYGTGFDGTVILQSVSMVALARSLVHASRQASTEGTAGSIRGLLGGSTD